MNVLDEARTHRPFSNSTEGESWTTNWCEHCEHDHTMSHDPAVEIPPGCKVLLVTLTESKHPDEWLPEPDDGDFSLPPRIVCTKFKPCRSGPCAGDPHAEIRAEVTAKVTAYWKDRT